MATTVIREFICRNRHFTIVKHEGFYCAIEDKYINEDGTLNTALNGGQLHASKDLNQCLGFVRDRVEIDYLKSTGMTSAEAFATYFGMLEKLAEIEEIMQ